MTHILHIIQIVSAVLTIVLVLIQNPQTDTGGFGGGDNASFAHSRRGAEKVIFRLTIIMAIVFALTSIAVIVIH